jgi:branched-chain amino acid transport system substrate-binding protein
VTLKTWTAVLLSAGLVASASACSSSSKNTTSKGSGGSTSSASAGGNSSATATPTGKPVEINMTIPVTGAYKFPEMKTAAEAAEKAINASGGINGRPLQVDICDTTSPIDPNPTQACIRKVISNQNIVAEVSDYSSFNDIITPLESKAGLAQIGGIPLGNSQLRTANVFPLEMPEEEAMGAALITNGSTKPSLIYIDIPTAQKAYDEINAWIKAAKSPYTLVAKQSAALTATDLSPQVAALCEGSDGVAMTLAYTQIVSFVTAHAQGTCPSQKLVTVALGLASYTPSLGSKANGMLVTSGLPLATDTSSKGIQMFQAQMNAVDPSAAKDEESVNTWLSVWAFAQEARKMGGDITRQSVLQYWNKLGSLQVFDLLPPGLNLQQGQSAIDGDSRLFNHWIRIGVVKDGQIIESGKGWVDVLNP